MDRLLSYTATGHLNAFPLQFWKPWHWEQFLQFAALSSWIPAPLAGGTSAAAALFPFYPSKRYSGFNNRLLKP